MPNPRKFKTSHLPKATVSQLANLIKGTVQEEKKINTVNYRIPHETIHCQNRGELCQEVSLRCSSNDRYRSGEETALRFILSFIRVLFIHNIVFFHFSAAQTFACVCVCFSCGAFLSAHRECAEKNVCSKLSFSLIRFVCSDPFPSFNECYFQVKDHRVIPRHAGEVRTGFR